MRCAEWVKCGIRAVCLDPKEVDAALVALREVREAQRRLIREQDGYRRAWEAVSATLVARDEEIRFWQNRCRAATDTPAPPALPQPAASQGNEAAREFYENPHPEVVERVRQAEAEVARGETVSLDDLRYHAAPPAPISQRAAAEAMRERCAEIVERHSVPWRTSHDPQEHEDRVRSALVAAIRSLPAERAGGAGAE